MPSTAPAVYLGGMRGRWVPALPELALAITLCAAKLAALGLGLEGTTAPLRYVAALLWTLPLAWRTSRPVAVAVVVAVTGTLEVTVAGYHNSVVGLAALVLIAYSLGAHAVGRVRTFVGLGAVVAAVAAYDLAQYRVQPPGSPVAEVAGNAAVIFVPFLGGVLVRQQRLRAQTLQRLAEELQRKQEERARTAVAEERTRIARELHDEVAHAMSVIAVQADAAEGALDHDPSLVRRPLVAIRDTAREALTDMRRVLGALRGAEAAELAPAPGLARVSALLDQARADGRRVELRIEGEPRPLPAAVDVAAYRTLQEGLTNARKHAAAHRVDVLVRYCPGAVEVEVRDDGDGSGAGGGTGRGLVGVRERVALLGGEFVAGPVTHGFVLHVRLPST